MKTENIKLLVEKEIKPFLEKLTKRKEVFGVVLLGGLGKREFLDKYSDIDISVFIRNKDKKKFSLPFEFHYDTPMGELEFNIHQQIIEDEEKKEKWDHRKIEAYSRGNILYDPTKRISKLIQSKTKFDNKEAFKRLVWIVQQYSWRGRIHSIRAIERGYPEVANDLLNQCTDLLLEAIYLLNKRYLPHKKWALVYLCDMPVEYSRLEKIFKRAMIVKAHSIEEVKRRIKELDKIYLIVKKKTFEEYPSFPTNTYEYYYRNFVQLNKKTIVDGLMISLKSKIILSPKEEKKLYGKMCFNLVTNKRLLKELFNSNNIKKEDRKGYKEGLLKKIKHGRNSAN